MGSEMNSSSVAAADPYSNHSRRDGVDNPAFQESSFTTTTTEEYQV